MKNGQVHIGTSGWSYPDWKGIYYPKELKSTEWIGYYSSTFHVTEINASFYHLPKKQTVEGWVDRVSGNFLFCPKMSRHLTHIKRLEEPEETLDRFFEVFEPMKSKMGPVLLQLPPSLVFDKTTATHLYRLFRQRYASYRFAMEGRHASWLSEESIALMATYDVVFVISQSGAGFPYAEHATAHDIYIRFHGPAKLYDSSYTSGELRQFAVLFRQWLHQGHVLWIFFNNCYHTYAIRNGLELEQLLGE